MCKNGITGTTVGRIIANYTGTVLCNMPVHANKPGKRGSSIGVSIISFFWVMLMHKQGDTLLDGSYACAYKQAVATGACLAKTLPVLDNRQAAACSIDGCCQKV